MLTLTLRKSGGSLIITIPDTFVKQNNLEAGTPVQVQINGESLTISTKPKPVYTLQQLLKEQKIGGGF